MIIRYSYRKKTGYKNNNNIDNIVNNKDVSADYDNTAYDITKFFLVLCSVGIIFHYCFSICSCSLCAPGGSRKVVLSSTNKPERLNPQLLFFFCFL